MKSPLNPREWEIISRNVLSWIRTPEQYLEAVSDGMQMAPYLASIHIPNGILSFEELKMVQRAIFQNVYKSAGFFREPGQEAVGRFPGSQATSVEGDLVDVKAELSKYFQEDIPDLYSKMEEIKDPASLAKAIETRIEAIASYNSALMRISPFLDGNGMTCCIIADIQIAKTFGVAVELESDMQRYDRAMREAVVFKNLRPLIDWMMVSSGLDTKCADLRQEHDDRIAQNLLQREAKDFSQSQAKKQEVSAQTATAVESGSKTKTPSKS